MSLALAQTNRTMRHPFRASLPAYLEQGVAKVPASDMQLFTMTFIAGFVAFYSFLA
ncbi:MAG: hypothetical protein JWO15_2666 [Sphingomonadales bacterium]|nr:hypothetical protein [Sphingomonadales bacterium]